MNVVPTRGVFSFNYIFILSVRAFGPWFLSSLCFETTVDVMSSFILTYRRPRAYSKEITGGISLERHLAHAIVSPTPAPALVKFEDLPEWCQDNPWVRGGYRPVNNSYTECAASCLQIHNETFNIFTHLLPAVGLLVAQFSVQQYITQYFPEATMMDRVALGANVLAAIITFALSAGYHTLMCHSMDVSQRWLRIDYCGILVLILGSFLTGVYIPFRCDPAPRNIYWSMITALSAITATLVLHPRLQGVQYRPHKAYAFIATALTGFAPITHGLYLYGWEQMMVRSGMPYYLLECLLYLTGAVFFITRFPESSWPGHFDIYFNSHSIFHVFVVLASFAHMYGVWTAYTWNYENLRSCGVTFN